MTPQKLPDGRWRVRAVVTVAGKQHRKQFTGERRIDVLRQAQDWVRDQTMPSSDLTVAQAVRRHLDRIAPLTAPSTVAKREGLYEKRLAALDTPVEYFDPQQFISDLAAEKLSRSTIRVHWSIVKASIEEVMPGKDLRVQLPKSRVSTLHCPDGNEFKRVTKVLAGTDLLLPALLAASIPARAGEICALTAEDFSFRVVSISKTYSMSQAGWEIVPYTKTPAGVRTVVIPEAVAKMVPKAGRIFSGTPQNLTQQFHRRLKKAGVTGIRFHDLRHYGASAMLTAGVPVKEVQRRGGWESQDVLMKIYAHALADQRAAADAVVDGIFQMA